MTPKQAKQGKTIKWKHVIRLAASALVVAVILFFLLRVLYGNWAQISQYDWSFNLPLLLLSYVALAGSYFVDIGVWWQTIKRMGERIPYLRALRLYFAASLAKYIPGTIWQFLGWFYLAQREGVSKIAAGTSVLLTQALSALAGAMLAMAAFAALGSTNLVKQLLPMLLIFPVAIVLLQPRVIKSVMNHGLRYMKRPPVEFDLRFRDLVAIFLMYLFSYVLWGLALFLFTNSLTHLPVTNFIPFLGVFPAAYALGLLAPFAPAGIGVREATLTYLLSLFMPLPVATVVALLTRPWMMTIDIVGGLLALGSYALQNRRSAKPLEQPANST